MGPISGGVVLGWHGEYVCGGRGGGVRWDGQGRFPLLATRCIFHCWRRDAFSTGPRVQCQQHTCHCSGECICTRAWQLHVQLLLMQLAPPVSSCKTRLHTAGGCSLRTARAVLAAAEPQRAIPLAWPACPMDRRSSLPRYYLAHLLPCCCPPTAERAVPPALQPGLRCASSPRYRLPPAPPVHSARLHAAPAARPRRLHAHAACTPTPPACPRRPHAHAACTPTLPALRACTALPGPHACLRGC